MNPGVGESSGEVVLDHHFGVRQGGGFELVDDLPGVLECLMRVCGLTKGWWISAGGRHSTGGDYYEMQSTQKRKQMQ